MMFDLQRFDDDTAQVTSAEPQPSQEEQEPIPEELAGLPEEYAREAMTEWEELQADEPEPAKPQISQEDYQAKVNEVEQLKAQLAAYRQGQAPQQAPQPAPQQQPPQTGQYQPQPAPQYQPPPFKITPEISAKINEAIKAEAMQMTGFSEDDVASLDYADDDDPHLDQWSQAKSIAQSRVLGAIQQLQQIQQVRAQQFLNEHTAAINTYNEFASKEFKEPDYKAIQNFAINDFFTQQPQNIQRIIANSYLSVERQTASPAEMLNVLMYYEKAKAAYRFQNGRRRTAASQPQPARQMPRVDQLNGSATAPNGELSAHDIEKLLEGDFTKLDQKTQNKLLHLT